MLHHKTRLLTVALLILAAGVLSSCSPSEPPELRQAADVIQHMMAPVNLSRSAFSVAFPEGKPSEYVSYLFSSMGSAEWPPSEEWADEMEIQAARSIGAPLMPAGVSFFACDWNGHGGTQLVVGYDDNRGIVILEGYIAQETQPIMRREIPLRRVAPAAGVALFYQSNMQMGMDILSFDPTQRSSTD